MGADRTPAVLVVGTQVFALLCLLSPVALLLVARYGGSAGRLVALLYATWLLLDGLSPWRGGRRSKWFRTLPLWRTLARYFPATLHVSPRYTQALTTVDKGAHPLFLFGLHPHGIISVSHIVNLLLDSTGGVGQGDGVGRLGVDYRCATVNANMILPGWREFALGLGFISADKSAVAAALARGTSVMLVVGGAAESLLSTPGSTDLVLLSRQGFVRLALQAGAALVPVYGFGEVELFGLVQPTPLLRALQVALAKVTAFTVPLFYGRGLWDGVGTLPRRVPLHTVVGPPLCLPRIADPTPEEVAVWHGRYVSALRDLFNEYAPALHRPVDEGGAPLPRAPLRVL